MSDFIALGSTTDDVLVSVGLPVLMALLTLIVFLVTRKPVERSLAKLPPARYNRNGHLLTPASGYDDWGW